MILSTGFLLSTGLPVGSEQFTLDHYTLSATLATDWDLGADWALGANPGHTAALSERPENPDTLRFAAAVWRSWAPLIEPLGSFAESAGEVPLDGSESALILHGGFAYLLTPLLQLDLSVQGGLPAAAPDLGAGLGVSWKW